MSKKRGFAAMSASKRRELSRRGGEAVAARPGHMAELGRRGGLAVSRDSAHMSRIGKLGKAASMRKGPA